LRIPLDCQVVKSKKCIVACAAGASRRKRALLERSGVKVMAFRGKRVPLKPFLSTLARQGIISLMVEGGGKVLGSFFDLRLVDRVCWFISPVILGSSQSRVAVAGTGAARLADASWLRGSDISPVGKSWLLRGNLSPWALD
jgi:diaminohydroxyphosphoribosylaminopyrimidine deaminase / 5-amino-6-(5-phosphoribosylamino)uracil reductase